MLAVTDLAKSFGSVAAVSKIEFTVGAGEVVGLLGPNGQRSNRSSLTPPMRWSISLPLTSSRP